MFQQDPDPRDPVASPAWLPALSAVLLIVTIGGLTTWLALKFDALSPKVGDMIVFLPSPPERDSWQLRVNATSVRRGETVSCVFDPNVLSVHGGSLIIEAREATSPPRFQLHWAGRHTAGGEGDCGGAADLVLDRYDLQRLANAAGGFGARPTAIR